tara:strand:+ start:480 stop:650 length:171 start_codon:yes stop_codon:yes gene_type:complete
LKLFKAVNIPLTNPEFIKSAQIFKEEKWKINVDGSINISKSIVPFSCLKPVSKSMD